MFGSKIKNASQTVPRLFVFLLSQLKRNSASPNASKPAASRMIIEPQVEKSAILHIANPVKAFMAWVAGSN